MVIQKARCQADAAAACGNTESSTENSTSAAPSGETSRQTASEADKTASADSRILVVYFSRTGEQYTVGVIDHGNTAIVAEMIAEETGADLFEVLPADDGS